VLKEVEVALVEALGVQPARASVSFVGVEPIEILRFDTGDVVSYISLGMSRDPMTSADQSEVQTDGPRAELMLQARVREGEAWQRLAVLAAAPVVEGLVYRPGMTVDLGVAIVADSRCTGGVVVASALASIATSAGLVDVMRVLPATANELAWARVRGSEALTERWDDYGADLLDLGRTEVRLD